MIPAVRVYPCKPGSECRARSSLSDLYFETGWAGPTWPVVTNHRSFWRLSKSEKPPAPNSLLLDIKTLLTRFCRALTGPASDPTRRVRFRGLQSAVIRQQIAIVCNLPAAAVRRPCREIVHWGKFGNSVGDSRKVLGQGPAHIAQEHNRSGRFRNDRAGTRRQSGAGSRPRRQTG